MIPFERFGTVSYSHSIATMAVSLAVLRPYTNATDAGQTPHDDIGRAPRKTTDKLQCVLNSAARIVSNTR